MTDLALRVSERVFLKKNCSLVTDCDISITSFRIVAKASKLVHCRLILFVSGPFVVLREILNFISNLAEYENF